MEKITFLVTINEGDWNNNIGGWNCPVLKIPSAEVEAFYKESREADRREYQIDKGNAIIKWVDFTNRPKNASISIVLAEALTTKTQTLQAQSDAKKAEKAASNNQRLAIILPFISAIVVAIIPFIFPVVLNWFPAEESLEKERVVPLNALGIRAYFINEENDDSIDAKGAIESIFRSPVVIQENGKKYFKMDVTLDNTQVVGRKNFIFTIQQSFLDSLQLGISMDNWIPMPNRTFQIEELTAGTHPFKTLMQ